MNERNVASVTHGLAYACGRFANQRTWALVLADVGTAANVARARSQAARGLICCRRAIHARRFVRTDA
jgi:hypothetical protein